MLERRSRTPWEHIIHSNMHTTLLSRFRSYWKRTFLGFSVYFERGWTRAHVTPTFSLSFLSFLENFFPFLILACQHDHRYWGCDIPFICARVYEGANLFMKNLLIHLILFFLTKVQISSKAQFFESTEIYSFGWNS